MNGDCGQKCKSIFSLYQNTDGSVGIDGVWDMDTIVDWPGRSDDITISFDVSVPHNAGALLADVAVKHDLPAIVYPETDPLRTILDVVWEEDIKKADQIDCLTAIACGTIAGLIDILFVDELSLERANAWGKNETNQFVKKIAKLNGYKGDDLSKAIAHMEKKFPLAADSKTSEFGGARQHHLRDFSHHFSLGGLLCSLFTQFTGKMIGTDTNGAILVEEAKVCALIGKNLEEKILFGTVNWFFHMVSDMAGSKLTAGNGTGIPGPLVSLIKELSALPCFRDKKIGEIEFHTWVSKLFNGTLLAKRDENGKILATVPFDLREEIGVLHEVSKQFVPVIINECLVRGLYFLRRLYQAISSTEINSVADLKNVNTSELLPYSNRVIKRMITVASGTFTAIDAVDAAVRAAIKNRGLNPGFFATLAVNINIVGVGRFIIACKADDIFKIRDEKEAGASNQESEKEYEKAIADLKCLSLDYEEMRALYSLERMMVVYDIRDTKDKKQQRQKRAWKDAWEKGLLSSMHITQEAAESFFIGERSIAKFIDERDPGTWLYLVAMEAMLFKPYYSIYGVKEKDDELKNLHFKSKYLVDIFTTKQRSIKKDDFESLQKAHKKAAASITKSTQSIVVGAIGTTAALIVSGGLAYVFAPAIAPVLAGGAAAHLSGAALVSHSLAVIGGGSLAAGGLGMAGGTAIITGGGALIGMLGSAGVSTAATVNLLAQDGYVLGECCKLLTFGRAILVDKYQDYGMIAYIQSIVENRMAELEKSIEVFSAEADSLEKAEKRKRKANAKVAAKSMRYLKRCDEALQKILASEKPTKNSALPKLLSGYKKG